MSAAATLQRLSKAIRRQASRAYIERRVTLGRSEVRQETAEEIRAALRGWFAAESAS